MEPPLCMWVKLQPGTCTWLLAQSPSYSIYFPFSILLMNLKTQWKTAKVLEPQYHKGDLDEAPSSCLGLAQPGPYGLSLLNKQIFKNKGKPDGK